MKFSIIMPVYNCENYLDKSINSVLGQTFKNWELILIDDGSEDSSGSKCDQYAEQNVNVKAFHIENAGPANARNVGLQQIDGDYCIFIDSDDFLKKNSLEILENSLSTESWDLIFFGYQEDIFIEGNLIPRKIAEASSRTYYTNADFSKDYVFYDKLGFTHPVWNKAYRTDLIKNNEIYFPSGINVSEDFIFNLQAYEKSSKICILSDLLYHYISHDSGNINSTFNVNKINNVFAVYEMSYQLMDRWNESNLNLVNNELIRNISVYINSMYNLECKLKYQEKRKIVNQIISNPSCTKCLKLINPLGNRNKILTLLLKIKLTDILLLTGKIARSELRKSLLWNKPSISK